MPAKHENMCQVVSSRDRRRVKALVFFFIHMYPTVKARESVGRRAKHTVRPRKFAYPQKTHVLLIKRSFEVQYPMGFGL